MPKKLASGFADVYASVADELRRRIGDAQAQASGPPASVEVRAAGDDDYARAWDARRPEATDAAMAALAARKYAEHVAAGMPEDKAERATAEDLTHFRYGQRLALYTHGNVDYADQIKEAKRLARLAEKRRAAQAEQPDPLGLPPMEQPAGPMPMMGAPAAPEPSQMAPEPPEGAY